MNKDKSKLNSPKEQVRKCFHPALRGTEISFKMVCLLLSLYRKYILPAMNLFLSITILEGKSYKVTAQSQPI
jgi:hypothetical protein